MSTKHKYPSHLLRITGLEGGQYGVLDLTARARDNLELNFGGDFVTLSRRDTEALLGGLEAFLALGEEHAPASDRPRHHPRDRDSERKITLTERVEERVEVTAPAPRRPRRGSASAEKSER
jgi:hypothetical protein